MVIALDDVTYREVMLEETKRRLTEAVYNLIGIYETHGFALNIPCMIGVRVRLETYKREISDCLSEI